MPGGRLLKYGNVRDGALKAGQERQGIVTAIANTPNFLWESSHLLSRQDIPRNNRNLRP